MKANIIVVLIMSLAIIALGIMVYNTHNENLKLQSIIAEHVPCGSKMQMLNKPE